MSDIDPKVEKIDLSPLVPVKTDISDSVPRKEHQDPVFMDVFSRSSNLPVDDHLSQTKRTLRFESPPKCSSDLSKFAMLPIGDAVGTHLEKDRIYRSVSSSDPPPFSGEGYKKWLDEFYLWHFATDIHPSKIGVLLFQSAKGRAKYVLSELPREIVVNCKPDSDYPNLTVAVASILRLYDTHFSRDESFNESFLFDKFSSLRRQGQFSSWQAYISEFRVRHEKVLNSGFSMPNQVASHTFIRNANLSSQDSKLLNMTLAARDITLKDIHVDRLMDLAKSLFQDVPSGSAEEHAFWVKGKGKRSRDNRTSPRYEYRGGTGRNKGKGKHYRYFNDTSNWHGPSSDRFPNSGSTRNFQPTGRPVSGGQNYRKFSYQNFGKNRGNTGTYSNGNQSSFRYTGTRNADHYNPNTGTDVRRSFPTDSKGSSKGKGKGKQWGKSGTQYSRNSHQTRAVDHGDWDCEYELIDETPVADSQPLPSAMMIDSFESEFHRHDVAPPQFMDHVIPTHSSPITSLRHELESLRSNIAYDSSVFTENISPVYNASLKATESAASPKEIEPCLSQAKHYTSYSKSMYGILDTACTSSICSEKWLKAYQTFLDKSNCRRPIRYRASNTLFRFANDTFQHAAYEADIPVVVGMLTSYIRVSVFRECRTDLLISLSTMENMGLIIDFKRMKVSSYSLGIRETTLHKDRRGNIVFPLYWRNMDHSDYHSVNALEEFGHLASEIVDASDVDMFTDFDNLDESTEGMTEELHQAFGVDQDFKDPKVIHKLHIQFGHASAQRIYKLLYHAHKKSLPDELNLAFIKEVIDKCQSCNNHRSKPIRPRFGGWLTDTFNEIVCIDLVELEDVEGEKLIVAHLIDVYTGLTYAQIIESKSTAHVVDFLWSWKVLAGRMPRLLFSDNGKEFCSTLMDQMCSLHDVDHKTTAPHHPFSNGLIERHNGILKATFNKIIQDQRNLSNDLQSSPESILAQCTSTLNAMPNDHGFTPYFLAFGQPSTPFSLNIHGTQPSQWNESSSYLPQIQARLELQRQAREIVFSGRILKQLHAALKKRVYHKDDFFEGDRVYFWKYDSNRRKSECFVGPATVVGRVGNMRIIEYGGKLISVPRYDLIPDQNSNRDDVHLDARPLVPDESGQSESSPQDGLENTRDFYTPEDVLVQWQNDANARQSQPSNWLELPDSRTAAKLTRPRYRTIPGFEICSSDSHDDLYRRVAPISFESRPAYQRDIVHRIPGRLITKLEEHLRLHIMPSEAKLQFRYKVPDQAHQDMIVEEYQDPLTNCIIRHNRTTGDKYVDIPTDTSQQHSMDRFFDQVQPSALPDKLDDFRSIYPADVLSRMDNREVSSPQSSRTRHDTPSDADKRFLEFSVSPLYHRIVRRGKITESDEDWIPGKDYLAQLELSESAKLVDSVSDLIVESLLPRLNQSTNISDAYIEHLESTCDTLPMYFDTCFGVDQEEVGISSYRTPSRQELDAYKSEFEESKRKEIESWLNNSVFDVIPDYEYSHGDNVISSKWIQNVKENQSGRIIKFKSRLVIRGFQDSQLELLQTDSPTVDKVSIRQLLQFASNHKYDVYSGDISTAFLQGKQFSTHENRVVFMRPPKGTNSLIGAPENAVWRLSKPAYGLADAPRRFYDNLRQAFSECGLERSLGDFAVFVYKEHGTTHGMLVSHVDDILYCGSRHFHDTCITSFLKRFRLGKLQKNTFDYTGSTIEVDSQSGVITMTQKHYTDKIEQVPLLKGHTDRTLSKEEYDAFRTGLGRLTWLSTTTRPDLAYDTNVLAQNQSFPQVQHMNTLHNTIQTAKEFSSVKLEFKPLNDQAMFILAFTDANLASTRVHSEDSTKFTSQTGTVILLGSRNKYGKWTCNLLDWKSSKQKRIARSTLAAETLAMVDTIDRAFGIKNHILHTQNLDLPVIILADCKSLVTTGHTTTTVSEKRLQIDIGYIREAIERKDIEVFHIGTQHMLADPMTKKMDTGCLRNIMKYHSLPEPVTDVLTSIKHPHEVAFLCTSFDQVQECFMISSLAESSEPGLTVEEVVRSTLAHHIPSCSMDERLELVDAPARVDISYTHADHPQGHDSIGECAVGTDPNTGRNGRIADVSEGNDTISSLDSVLPATN